jgi:DNA polymerase-3 subunit gamma/tau
VAAEPRYHLEMALLRWMHLRKLVPIERLIEQVQSGVPGVAAGPSRPPREPAASRPTVSEPARRVLAQQERRPQPPKPAPAAPAATVESAAHAAQSGPAPGLTKDAFLAELQQARPVFARTVLAQAQRVDIEADRVVFAFGPSHAALRVSVEQNRSWLEAIVERLAGRRMPVVTITVDAIQSPPALVPAIDASETVAGKPDPKTPDLKARALADPAVKALLDVFPAEIRDVQEIKE